MRGSARNTSHAPRSVRRLAERIATAARFFVGAAAVFVLATATIVDTSDPDVGALRLVDEDHSDGGGSQDPSGEPSGSPSQSGEPGGGEDPDESDPADDEGSEGGSKAESDSAGWVPIAVQAGASLGLVGLAAVALIPGRRPPERVRAR